MLSVGIFWNLWTEFLHRMKWRRENMETVRKYVGVDSLMKVMRLSEKFRNRKLEVIILPIEEYQEGFIRAVDIDRALQSLVGEINPIYGYVFRRVERGTVKKLSLKYIQHRYRRLFRNNAIGFLVLTGKSMEEWLKIKGFKAWWGSLEWLVNPIFSCLYGVLHVCLNNLQFLFVQQIDFSSKKTYNWMKKNDIGQREII